MYLRTAAVMQVTGSPQKSVRCDCGPLLEILTGKGGSYARGIGWKDGKGETAGGGWKKKQECAAGEAAAPVHILTPPL